MHISKTLHLSNSSVITWDLKGQVYSQCISPVFGMGMFDRTFSAEFHCFSCEFSQLACEIISVVHILFSSVI